MAVVSPPASAKRRTINYGELREHLTGYLFILPAVLIVALFGLFPIGIVSKFGFTDLLAAVSWL